MATRAIEKGMPIEQVQKILGHEQIDNHMRLYQKPCARVNSKCEDFEVKKLEFENSHYG